MCGMVWQYVATSFDRIVKSFVGSADEQQHLQDESTKMILKGSVVVQKKHTLDLTNVTADIVDDAADILGFKVKFQLISESGDPANGCGKRSEEMAVGGWYLSLDGVSAGDIQYKVNFRVDKEFGIPGAIIVKNHHAHQFFLKSFTLLIPDNDTSIHFVCNSWVFNTSKYTSDRVFFRNQVYLPQHTPSGVKEFREKELISIRGDGTGVRKSGERIYDYDVYNDLGNPDKIKDHARPVLGGSMLPYPRRIRTGRMHTNADEDSESLPVDDMYIPADEEMGKVRYSSFLGDSLKAAAHKLVPAIRKFYATETSTSFASFKEIKSLYNNGINFGPESDLLAKKKSMSAFTLISELTTDDENSGLLRYPLPQLLASNEDGWMSDDEFARQALAGLNPLTIQALNAYPPTSNLDTLTFGLQASALTNAHIENHLEGLSVQQALEGKRLYILDFHDIFLPYLRKINSQNGRKMYASRTILFLTNEGTLKMLAIELSLPSSDDNAQRSNRVFLPPKDNASKDWLWELAKAHVAVNDTGYHQLISHWMKTHAIMEPIIIATHRQLSTIHPINLLLLPHFKNTMAINSRARSGLINAGGIIEENFTTGKHSMEMSAVVYDLLWRFDKEGLPQDLIRRGMAVDNPNMEHGLELSIKDYPYANDGLDIWAAIKSWVEEYVSIFYVDDTAVVADSELRSWWSEIKTVGHADKRNEEWWSTLSTNAELIEVLTTIIWVASAHHAAVNFGQYAYAGYSPNRPTAAHKHIPEEGSAEFHELQKCPEKFFLSAISSKVEAATVMTTLEILSTHAADEEYLGERKIDNWTSNQRVLDAFSRFSKMVLDVEMNVVRRNKEARLRNRHGPVNMAYTLLCINSRPGLTGRGVPNSISI